MSEKTERYWYHPESDSAFIDNDPSQETAEICVEWDKHEYDAFMDGQKKLENKKMATLQEMEARYAELEKNARDVSLGIGQHEQRIDHALEGLRKSFPDMKFDDPRDIDFEKLIGSVQAEIEQVTDDLDKEFSTIEGKVESANAELQQLVEQKG